jgi:hypothetical protein
MAGRNSIRPRRWAGERSPRICFRGRFALAVGGFGPIHWPRLLLLMLRRRRRRRLLLLLLVLVLGGRWLLLFGHIAHRLPWWRRPVGLSSMGRVEAVTVRIISRLICRGVCCIFLGLDMWLRRHGMAVICLRRGRRPRRS